MAQGLLVIFNVRKRVHELDVEEVLCQQLLKFFLVKRVAGVIHEAVLHTGVQCYLDVGLRIIGSVFSNVCLTIEYQTLLGELDLFVLECYAIAGNEVERGCELGILSRVFSDDGRSQV